MIGISKDNRRKGVVNLDDAELLNYLRNASGFALKSVFILSSHIVLTDKERKYF